MTSENPFAPQAETKKHLVSATINDAQREALEGLRQRMGLATQAAVLKAGLALLMEKYPPAP
jgi:hypothetical protein